MDLSHSDKPYPGSWNKTNNIYQIPKKACCWYKILFPICSFLKLPLSKSDMKLSQLFLPISVQKELSWSQ